MNLPPVTGKYDPATQSEIYTTIRQADSKNMKLDKDNFIDSGSLCLQSPDGTWFVLSVDNSGTLSTTELTSASGRIDSEGRPLIATTNPYS